MNMVLKKGMEIAEASGINIAEDDFTIVQPYNDTNAIVITVEDDEVGKRTVGIKITDTVVVLEQQLGTLDVFKQKDDKSSNLKNKRKQGLKNGKNN